MENPQQNQQQQLKKKRKNIQKKKKKGVKLKWFPIGNGNLALAPFPGKKVLSQLKVQNVNVICTIMGEEHSYKLGEKILNLGGINWIHIPLRKANPDKITKEMEIMIYEKFSIIKKELENGENVIFHCAAGIHRTGMVSYAFLLYMKIENPLEALKTLRKVTFEGVGEKRLKWSKEFIDRMKGKSAKINTIKEES